MSAPSASKQKQWPRSRRIGGRSITPLKPTPAYQARKAALTDDQARLSLDLVEERIAVDPDHRSGREQVGDLIYDMTEPGIMVVYSVIEGEAVLVTFRDLFNS
jgi:hypothetical protein